jgi:hypothetical protein
MSETPANPTNTKSSTLMALDDYLKGLMKLQNKSIDQANVDQSTIMQSLKSEQELRQADTDQIAKLEEAVL